MHISLRNTLRHGWCFISTFDYVGRLTDDSISWLPFEDEVFALKTDGSGDVQRIAHHHSRRFSPATPDPDNSVYWAEPHATVNRAGTKVIWGSNWRENMDQVWAVDSYICDFSGWAVVEEKKSNEGMQLSVFPDPAKDRCFLRCNHSWSGMGYLTITDTFGRKIFEREYFNIEPGLSQIPFDVSAFNPGLYCLRFKTTDQCNSVLFVVIR